VSTWHGGPAKSRDKTCASHSLVKFGSERRSPLGVRRTQGWQRVGPCRNPLWTNLDMSKRRRNFKIATYDPQVIKNILRGNTTRLRTVFSEIRREIDSSAYPAIIRDIYRQPFYQQKLFGTPFPRNPAQLKRLQALNGAGLDRDILWSTALILDYAPEINRAAAFKRQLTVSFLFGSPEGTLKLLDAVASDMGMSLWTEEARIYLTNEVFGPDKKKELLQSYFSTPGINGLIYYIFYYFGFRAEESASLSQIRDVLAPLTNLHSYLIYKLTPFSASQSFSKPNLEGLIRHESNSSLFDLYETLCRVLQLVVTDSALLEAYSSVVSNCASRLSDQIPDHRTRLLKILLNKDEPIPDEPATRKALHLENAYIGRDFQLNATEVIQLILASWAPREVEKLAKIPPAMRKVADGLQHIMQHDEQLEAEFSLIEKFCSLRSGLDYSHSLFSCAQKARDGSHTGLFSDLLGALDAGAYLPDIVEHLVSPEQRLQYLARLEQTYGHNVSIEFFKAQATNTELSLPELGPAATRWLAINRTGSTKLLEDAPGTLKRTGLEGPALRKVVTQLLQHEKDVVSACDLVAKRYVANPFIWPQLPLAEIASSIQASNKIDQKKLSLPIFWDIYARHVDQKATQQRAYAVEDSWEAAGAQKPSELPIPTAETELHLFWYYLNVLCIPSILDESDAFQKASDVDQERIKICQILAEVDPAHSELYQAEIRSITRRLVIQEGVRRVEQSKIYVDIDGLYKELLEVLRPDYERVIALRRNQIVGGEVSDIVKKDIRRYRDDEITGQLMLSIEQEKPDISLLRIVLRIWKEFASNSHHGLDVYLSTRIRHGTLIGHLRRPFEEQSLICQRDAVSGKYKDQPFWAERLSSTPITERECVQESLKIFSAEIDAEISHLNSENLRVRTSEKDKGWFSFIPTDAEFLHIQTSVEGEISLQKFLEIGLRLLWNRLGKILTLVRGELSTALRAKWLARLGRLRDEIQKQDLGSCKYDLDAAIVRAQGGIAHTIDRVSNWFTLSSSTTNPDYTIDLAIEIAIESAKNCLGSTSVAISKNQVSGPMLIGRTLASFVDLFFILIENAVRHARPEGAPCLLDINTTEADGLFTIVATNNVTADADAGALAKRIVTIKQTLADKRFDVVAMEGGSGFHKLRKIIMSDFGSENMFDFEVSNNQFVVTIVFDARGIMA
jgi:hypothetical protein